MVLFCVGDVDPEQVFAVTDRMIRPDKLDMGEIERFYPQEPEETAKDRVEMCIRDRASTPPKSETKTCGSTVQMVASIDVYKRQVRGCVRFRHAPYSHHTPCAA